MSKRKKRKFLTDEEFQILRDYIKNQADLARKKGASRAVIDELIINMLLIAGLKANELCSLQIRDTPAIHGENCICIRNENQQVIRKVSISPEFVSLISRFVAIYRKAAQQKDPLLQSERGNPISYFSLYCKIKKIETSSGISPLSPAILRHTYVMRLYNVEQDLRYVQDQAGYTNHRSIFPYINPDETIKDLDVPQICEACSAQIQQGRGKRIESGQFLCQDCLGYFQRSKS